jgi:hypothetical protein
MRSQSKQQASASSLLRLRICGKYEGRKTAVKFCGALVLGIKMLLHACFNLGEYEFCLRIKGESVVV